MLFPLVSLGAEGLRSRESRRVRVLPQKKDR
jgi:hypothetical protein